MKEKSGRGSRYAAGGDAAVESADLLCGLHGADGGDRRVCMAAFSSGVKRSWFNSVL